MLTLTLPEFQEVLFIRIDRTPTPHSPRVTPGHALNFIEFRLASEPESVIRLNSSTNLTDWQDWRQITNTTGDDIFLDGCGVLDSTRLQHGLGWEGTFAVIIALYVLGTAIFNRRFR